MTETIDLMFSPHQVLVEAITRDHPSLLEGKVVCGRCGKPRPIDAQRCLRDGWPKCEETTRCATRAAA